MPTHRISRCFRRDHASQVIQSSHMPVPSHAAADRSRGPIPGKGVSCAGGMARRPPLELPAARCGASSRHTRGLSTGRCRVASVDIVRWIRLVVRCGIDRQERKLFRECSQDASQRIYRHGLRATCGSRLPVLDVRRPPTRLPTEDQQLDDVGLWRFSVCVARRSCTLHSGRSLSPVRPVAAPSIWRAADSVCWTIRTTPKRRKFVPNWDNHEMLSADVSCGWLGIAKSYTADCTNARMCHFRDWPIGRELR